MIIANVTNPSRKALQILAEARGLQLRVQAGHKGLIAATVEVGIQADTAAGEIENL